MLGEWFDPATNLWLKAPLAPFISRPSLKNRVLPKSDRKSPVKCHSANTCDVGRGSGSSSASQWTTSRARVKAAISGRDRGTRRRLLERMFA